MTTRGATASPKSVLVGDTGILVGFILGGQVGILKYVCDSRNFVLHVPKIVDKELRRVLKRKQQDELGLKAWESMKQLGLVVVLDEPTVGSSVAKLVATYVSLRQGVSATSTKDLGEYYVISHAVELRASGHTVAVAIDDATARRFARQKTLEVLTTEDLLDHAISLGLFPTIADLRQSYKEIGTASTLRPLNETMLEWHFKVSGSKST